VEQKNKNRARVKVAVFFVLAIHAVGLLALLMQGCRRDQPTETVEQQTNNVAEPTFTNNTPPVVAEPPPSPIPTNAAAVEPVVPSVNTAAQDYKVVKGDNYTTIAKKYPGVSVKALTDANPGVDPAKLKIGQTLHIPPAAAATTAVAPGSAATSATSSDIYVVKSGDSLSKIATKYNTTVKAIRSANSLSTDSIKVGQKLKIPGKATTSSTPTTAPAAPTDTTVPPAPTTPK